MSLSKITTTVALLSTLTQCHPTGPSHKDLLVDTNTFSVQGVSWPNTAGVSFWGNIPYAEPPVDSLRFRPPVTKRAINHTIDGSWFGPSCIQYSNGQKTVYSEYLTGFLLSPGQQQSEDCLTLNVWAPAEIKKNEKLPVMIWIHGGGFTSGGSASPYKYGDRLAKDQNVIVVAMKYAPYPLSHIKTPYSQPQLPPQHFRLPQRPRPPWPRSEPWAPRPTQSRRMDPCQHRLIRRQPRPDDPLRPIRRRHGRRQVQLRVPRRPHRARLHRAIRHRLRRLVERHFRLELHLSRQPRRMQLNRQRRGIRVHANCQRYGHHRRPEQVQRDPKRRPQPLLQPGRRQRYQLLQLHRPRPARPLRSPPHHLRPGQQRRRLAGAL